jgi:hypothetical protein
MRGFAFRTGLDFEWDGATHRIERLGAGDQVALERLGDGQTVLSSQQESWLPSVEDCCVCRLALTRCLLLGYIWTRCPPPRG